MRNKSLVKEEELLDTFDDNETLEMGVTRKDGERGRERDKDQEKISGQ